MRDQLLIHVQIPGGPAVPIRLARLIDPDTHDVIIDFTFRSDHVVYIELDAIFSGPYQLLLELPDHPTLTFSVTISGESDRTFDFVEPVPACATVSIQQASAGPSMSQRIHIVNFALPPTHEAVVLVAGADLKGDTRYVKFAETWRDDLYHGRTDLGGQPNQPIPRAIQDHTVVSIFDFRTGYFEKQIKGVKGWHRMYRAMQGTEPPDIKRPKDDDALARRQAADSISIVHVYEHIAGLGNARAGCLRQLHFFAHAYLRGPVLQNTSDSNSGVSDLRDPTDKDARTKDFLPVNLAQYPSLPYAFTTNTLVKNWGCFGSDMSKKLWAVANTETLDEVRKVKDTDQTYSSADVMRELKMYTFPESYMLAFCRELGVDGWALPPGAKSIYKTSRKYHYFYAKPSHYGPILGWYERFYGCKRDLGGAISFRTFL